MVLQVLLVSVFFLLEFFPLRVVPHHSCWRSSCPSQDNEIGDGTTGVDCEIISYGHSSLLLIQEGSCEFLVKECTILVNCLEGAPHENPQHIIFTLRA